MFEISFERSVRRFHPPQFSSNPIFASNTTPKSLPWPGGKPAKPLALLLALVTLPLISLCARRQQRPSRGLFQLCAMFMATFEPTSALLARELPHRCGVFFSGVKFFSPNPNTSSGQQSLMCIVETAGKLAFLYRFFNHRLPGHSHDVSQ